MATSSQPEYQLLVANFSRPTPSSIEGSDTENQAPTKTRTGFVFRNIQGLGFATDLVSSTSSPSRSVVKYTRPAQMDPFGGTPPPTADVEVVSDSFSGQSAVLVIGRFKLVANRDFATGGGTAATATNIATAVSALPGYTGSVAGSVVTVEGPEGQQGIPFRALYRGGEENFSFTYQAEDGVLSQGIGGGPVEAPTILAAGSPNGVAP